MIITACDIHVFCESKRDGHWCSADHYKYSWEYQNGDLPNQHLEIVPIYSDRSYPLFGLLAGVRCGWFQPIDFPRGLPDDVSNIVLQAYKNEISDAHTCTWYTLKELMDWREGHLNFNPDNVSNSQKQALDILGISYWQWQECLNNVGVELDEDDWKESIDALDKLLDAMKDRACEEFWIYDFYSDEKKQSEIQKIANDFRIVFWFDN